MLQNNMKYYIIISVTVVDLFIKCSAHMFHCMKYQMRAPNYGWLRNRTVTVQKKIHKDVISQKVKNVRNI